MGAHFEVLINRAARRSEQNHKKAAKGGPDKPRVEIYRYQAKLQK